MTEFEGMAIFGLIEIVCVLGKGGTYLKLKT